MNHREHGVHTPALRIASRSEADVAGGARGVHRGFLRFFSVIFVVSVVKKAFKKQPLRDPFLPSFLDTDATDFTEVH